MPARAALRFRAGSHGPEPLKQSSRNSWASRKRPSWRPFRRRRAGEQGRSLPPPAPPASLSLFRENTQPSRPRNSSHKTGPKDSTGTASQDKFHHVEVGVDARRSDSARDTSSKGN